MASREGMRWLEAVGLRRRGRDGRRRAAAGTAAPVVARIRWGANGVALHVQRSDVNGRWTWWMKDANGQEIANGSRSYQRGSDALRGARRALRALASLRPRL
jgi:hypothetical protein